MALRKQDFDDNDKQAPHEVEQSQLTIGIDTAVLHRLEEIESEHNLSVEEYLRQILHLIAPGETRRTQQSSHVVPDDIDERAQDLEQPLAEKRRPVTLKTLNAFLQIREEIMQAHQGQHFTDSTENIHQMRDERTQELGQL